MTPLRQQLIQARAEHRAATYPGDLAAHVIGEHDRRNRWRLFAVRGGGAAAALVAACVAVGIFLYRPTSQTPITSAAAAAEVNFSIPGKPEMPESLSIVPDYQELTTIPAKPEFPSIYESL
jgi:hypothetical protein